MPDCIGTYSLIFITVSTWIHNELCMAAQQPDQRQTVKKNTLFFFITDALKITENSGWSFPYTLSRTPPTPCAFLICCFPSLLFVQSVNNVSAEAIWRRHWEQLHPLWGHTIHISVGSAIGFVPHRGTNFYRHYLYSIMPRHPVHCNIWASHRCVAIWQCVVGYILSEGFESL